MGKHKITNWKPVHTKVLKIFLNDGYDPKNIAQKTKLSPRTISWIVNSTTFKKKVATVEDYVPKEVARRVSEKLDETTGLVKAAEKLANSVAKAANKILEIMDKGTSHQRIQLDAAKEVLHLAGFRPQEKSAETRDRELSPEEIKYTKETLVEIVRISERLTNNPSRFLLRKATVHQRSPAKVDDAILTSSGRSSDTDESSEHQTTLVEDSAP